MPTKRLTRDAFRALVITVVKKIPRGSVLTYGEVARRAGHIGAARAVGSLMKANHDPRVPCYRVVRADGRVGEYNRPGGSLSKWRRLQREGVDMTHLRP